MSRILSPKSRPLFKIKPEVIRDQTFQDRLKDSLIDWQEVRDLGLDVLTWWKVMVKQGIKKLAIKRSKQMNRERRGELNLLFLRQAHLARQIQNGRIERLGELRSVQLLIQDWYETESKKVILQSRADDVNQSEKVRIYHHDIHKRNIKRGSILKLQTEFGLLEGHSQCASYLENQVGDLLLNPAPLDVGARQCLLEEVVQVYTEQDNEMFKAVPDEKEVKKVISASNLLAAPGTDSIPSLLYQECWPLLKKPLTNVIQAIHAGAGMGLPCPV